MVKRRVVQHGTAARCRTAKVVSKRERTGREHGQTQGSTGAAGRAPGGLAATASGDPSTGDCAMHSTVTIEEEATEVISDQALRTQIDSLQKAADAFALSPHYAAQYRQATEELKHLKLTLTSRKAMSRQVRLATPAECVSAFGYRPILHEVWQQA